MELEWGEVLKENRINNSNQICCIYSVGLTQKVLRWTRQSWTGVMDSLCCRGKARRFDLVPLRRQKEQAQSTEQRHQRMNSASRENVPADEWQGRCCSFLTANVALTQRFHLCSWLSRYAPEFPSRYPSAFLMSSVNEHTLRNTGAARLASSSLLMGSWGCPLTPAYFCTLFDFLYPACPGLSLQQGLNTEQ